VLVWRSAGGLIHFVLLALFDLLLARGLLGGLLLRLGGFVLLALVLFVRCALLFPLNGVDFVLRGATGSTVSNGWRRPRAALQERLRQRSREGPIGDLIPGVHRKKIRPPDRRTTLANCDDELYAVAEARWRDER
jgi:hypothetical protein